MTVMIMLLTTKKKKHWLANWGLCGGRFFCTIYKVKVERLSCKQFLYKLNVHIVYFKFIYIDHYTNNSPFLTALSVRFLFLSL